MAAGASSQLWAGKWLGWVHVGGSTSVLSQLLGKQQLWSLTGAVDRTQPGFVLTVEISPGAANCTYMENPPAFLGALDQCQQIWQGSPLQPENPIFCRCSLAPDVIVIL